MVTIGQELVKTPYCLFVIWQLVMTKLAPKFMLTELPPAAPILPIFKPSKIKGALAFALKTLPDQLLPTDIKGVP